MKGRIVSEDNFFTFFTPSTPLLSDETSSPSPSGPKKKVHWNNLWLEDEYIHTDSILFSPTDAPSELLMKSFSDGTEVDDGWTWNVPTRERRRKCRRRRFKKTKTGSSFWSNSSPDGKKKSWIERFTIGLLQSWCVVLPEDD